MCRKQRRCAPLLAVRKLSGKKIVHWRCVALLISSLTLRLRRRTLHSLISMDVADSVDGIKSRFMFDVVWRRFCAVRRSVSNVHWMTIKSKRRSYSGFIKYRMVTFHFQTWIHLWSLGSRRYWPNWSRYHRLFSPAVSPGRIILSSLWPTVRSISWQAHYKSIG